MGDGYVSDGDVNTEDETSSSDDDQHTSDDRLVLPRSLLAPECKDWSAILDSLRDTAPDKPDQNLPGGAEWFLDESLLHLKSDEELVDVLAWEYVRRSGSDHGHPRVGGCYRYAIVNRSRIVCRGPKWAVEDVESTPLSILLDIAACSDLDGVNISHLAQFLLRHSSSYARGLDGPSGAPAV
jgi:hypothetical protein